MWFFFTIAILVIKLDTENCNAQLMYLLGPRCTVENSATDQHPTYLHFHIWSQCRFRVFSSISQQLSLDGKCIFCLAQLNGCIFADVKEERRMSTCSTWVQVCYICESCVQYIPAMGTLKCCGVGNSHELLSHSLVFLAQYLWNVFEYERILLSFCLHKLVLALWSIWRWL